MTVAPVLKHLHGAPAPPVWESKFLNTFDPRVPFQPAVSKEQPCSPCPGRLRSLLCLVDCLQAQLMASSSAKPSIPTALPPLRRLCTLSPPSHMHYDYLLTLSSCLPSPKNEPRSSYFYFPLLPQHQHSPWPEYLLSKCWLGEKIIDQC